MFVLCPLVGYFLQCGPYNTIVVALFTQGGVGVVMGLQARQGVNQDSHKRLVNLLTSSQTSSVCVSLCGNCTAFDYDQLAPTQNVWMFSKAKVRPAVCYGLWVCFVYLKEGGSAGGKVNWQYSTTTPPEVVSANIWAVSKLTTLFSPRVDV